MRCKQIQLFLIRHRRAAFSTSENDGLALLWNGELTTQFCCRSQKTTDARSDVIVHSVFIKKSHLFLNSTINTWITCMKPNDQLSLIIKLLHQLKLLLKIKICTTPYRSTLFSTICQFSWYET